MPSARADHHRRHDGEAVEAVGEVDRVARADDDEVRQRDEAPDAERIRDRLEERHDQVGLRRQADAESPLSTHARKQLRERGVVGRRHREREIDRGDDADQRLPEELRARRQPLRIAGDDLAPVVDPADGAEAERDQQHDPDEAVVEIGPQQRRDGDRDEDQRAAHRRRPGLGQVRLRAVVAHRLPDAHPRQPRDHPRPDDETR